jgi:hypothetical protein
LSATKINPSLLENESIPQWGADAFHLELPTGRPDEIAALAAQRQGLMPDGGAHLIGGAASM